MNYYEFSFTYISPTEKGIINDTLAAELEEIGFRSFTESEKGLLGYTSGALYDRKTLDGRPTDFPLKNTRTNRTSKWIESRNWNEEWEKSYSRPIRIENEYIIHASFHKVGSGYIHSIIIDPEMVFSTDNHETIHLMIGEMLKLDLEGRELPGMGCGAAALAILARLEGAKRVAVIDTDEWVYNNVLENIRLSCIKDI